jgi:predicted transcriptional regulator
VPDIPDKPTTRKSYLLRMGLTTSDVKVFEYILQRTMYANPPTHSTPLSLTDIEAGTGVVKRTVQRSLDRLTDLELVERVVSFNRMKRPPWEQRDES